MDKKLTLHEKQLQNIIQKVRILDNQTFLIEKEEVKVYFNKNHIEYKEEIKVFGKNDGASMNQEKIFL